MHYLSEHAHRAALDVVDALEHAYAHIGGFPASGSLRFAYELEIPGLRPWSVTGFPSLIFYIEREDHIDVGRVSHTRRDVPAAMDDVL